MQILILILHVLTCVAIITLVLMQHGKGADIGATFGSGASQTVFGSRGSGSFLFKITGGLAAIFFATALVLGYIATQQVKSSQKLPVMSVEQSQTTKKQQPPAASKGQLPTGIPVDNQ